MDLSMSMRVDRHADDQPFRIPPRTPATWIPDARVKRCFHCNTEFNFWRRKHHCRSCGRIFCDPCSDKRFLIPSYFRADTPSSEQDDGKETRRVCSQCAEQLKRANDMHWLVRALAVMPVTFQELMTLRLLCSDWNKGVNTIIGLYRGLQYKLPSLRYPTILCEFLWTHYREFVGHVPWQLHAFASLKQHGLLKERLPILTKCKSLDSSCKRLLCSRHCRPALSVDDILKVASTMTLSEYSIQNWVIVAWHSMQPVVHLKMMPWWVYIAQRFKRLFTEGLLPICEKRIDLAYSIYFECDLQKSKKNWKLLKMVQHRLMKRLQGTTLRDLNASVAFVNLLVTIQTKSSEWTWLSRITEFFEAHEIVRLPWKPSSRIVGIDGASMHRLNTSSRPIFLTCWTEKNKRLEFILKGEDVRSDRLAMTIGYWINTFAQAHVQIYDVFPLSQNVGIVTMIPDASTLYDVKHRKNISLLNFILQNNLQVHIHKIRQRIVSSVAGASLLAFTMGLGDRHLDNILVTKSGLLVHVDFGYILGDDPKLAYTHMRLTEDMIDAMGGRHSQTFAHFQRVAQKAYEALRPHTSFWYHLLSAEYFIFKDHNRHWKQIRNHVLDRFVPGEWNDEASLQIEAVVDRAARPSWSQQLTDFTHAASNHMSEMFQMDL